MAFKTCGNCGSKVFSLGCVNCDEQNYIDDQREQDASQDYPLGGMIEQHDIEMEKELLTQTE